jgi:hypothetical protein
MQPETISKVTIPRELNGILHLGKESWLTDVQPDLHGSASALGQSTRWRIVEWSSGCRLVELPAQDKVSMVGADGNT